MIIFVVCALLVTAGLVVLVNRYRSNPAHRAVLSAIVRDRTALTVGGAVTAVMLALAVVDGGVIGLLQALVLALAVGALIATLVHRVRAGRTGG